MLQTSDGTIYAAGGGVYATNDAAIIIKSSDRGASWTTEYLYQPSPGNEVLFTDMKVAPDGTIVASGNQNPDGTNDEVFIAVKPPFQAFSLVATFERQDTFPSATLSGGLSPDLTYFAVGIASNGVPDDAMLLESPIPYQTLGPRTLLNDSQGYNANFTALAALSDSDVRVTGLSTDAAAAYDAIIGRIDGSGVFTEEVRAPFECCLADASLHDPTDLLINGPGQYLLSLSPGTTTANLRAKVLTVDSAIGIIGEYTLNPDLPGATLRLQRHGNRTVAISLVITTAAPTGTFQVDVSSDYGRTFVRSMNPDTDGLIANDGVDSSIQQSGTYALNDGTLIMPLSVDAAVDATTPVLFYELGCY